MLWTPGGRSSNLEDRRSLGGGGVGRGLGIGGTVVVLALSLIFGRNLFNDLGVQPAVGAENTAPFTAADSAAQETEVQFISYVLDDVQNTYLRTSSVITCNTCWAPTRKSGGSRNNARTTRTRCPCGSSCRLIATPVCGRIPARCATACNRATSRKRSTRPRRSATIASSNRRPVASTSTPLLTAPLRNVRHRSAKDLIRAIRDPAISAPESSHQEKGNEKATARSRCLFIS